jgi:hypothetical protein
MFEYKASNGTFTVETPRGTYEIQREGSSWGLYWEGSRFGAADTLRAAKRAVEADAGAES